VISPVERFGFNVQVAEYCCRADSGNEVTKFFRPPCSSPVLGRNGGTTGHVSVPVGTIADATGLEPEVVIFAPNRKQWDVMH